MFFSFQCRGLGCFQLDLILNILDLDAIYFKIQLLATSNKNVFNFCILTLYTTILLVLVFFKVALGFSI